MARVLTVCLTFMLSGRSASNASTRPAEACGSAPALRCHPCLLLKSGASSRTSVECKARAAQLVEPQTGTSIGFPPGKESTVGGTRRSSAAW